VTTPTDYAGRLRDVLRTACGRELTVSTLRPDPVGGHGGRIVLGTSLRPDELERCWSGLTADEARLLAGYLLAHAAEAGSAR
jgi:hypothetical protein